LPEWETSDHIDYPTERIEIARFLGIQVPPGLDPYAARAIFGDEELWGDRIARDASATTIEESIGVLAERWLEKEQARVQTSQLSPRGYANSRSFLRQFVKFVGESLPPSAIDETLVERYHLHLMRAVASREISPSNAKNKFN